MRKAELGATLQGRDVPRLAPHTDQEIENIGGSDMCFPWPFLSTICTNTAGLGGNPGSERALALPVLGLEQEELWGPCQPDHSTSL